MASLAKSLLNMGLAPKQLLVKWILPTQPKRVVASPGSFSASMAWIAFDPRALDPGAAHCGLPRWLVVPGGCLRLLEALGVGGLGRVGWSICVELFYSNGGAAGSPLKRRSFTFVGCRVS